PSSAVHPCEPRLSSMTMCFPLRSALWKRFHIPPDISTPSAGILPYTRRSAGIVGSDQHLRPVAAHAVDAQGPQAGDDVGPLLVPANNAFVGRVHLGHVFAGKQPVRPVADVFPARV